MDDQSVKDLHETIYNRFGLNARAKLWDGSPLGPSMAESCIHFRYPWSLRAVLQVPLSLSFGEAYVEGLIDIEGDLPGLITEMAAIQLRRLGWRGIAELVRLRNRLPRSPRRQHARRAKLYGRMHTRARDRAAIAFHYDLPQQFYEQFLDDHLVYSCAYFSGPHEDLSTAQQRKLDVVCRKLRLRPGMRILDVGCGWGSLLIHAAQNYGVSGVGVTISRTQFAEAKRRIEHLGLDDRVEIRFQDYRDVRGHFDAISSIGMLEHIGPANMQQYVATLANLLTPSGLLLNHGIIFHDATRFRHGKERTFITDYVFPDGGLVPAWRLMQATQQTGLVVLDVEQLGQHYGLTLRKWIQRLEDHHDAVLACASEADYRVWRAYMAMSAVGFETEVLGVVQLLAGKAGVSAELPLGRQWMMPAFPQVSEHRPLPQSDHR